MIGDDENGVMIIDVGLFCESACVKSIGVAITVAVGVRLCLSSDFILIGCGAEGRFSGFIRTLLAHFIESYSSNFIFMPSFSSFIVSGFVSMKAMLFEFKSRGSNSSWIRLEGE